MSSQANCYLWCFRQLWKEVPPKFRGQSHNLTTRLSTLIFPSNLWTWHSRLGWSCYIQAFLYRRWKYYLPMSEGKCHGGHFWEECKNLLTLWSHLHHKHLFSILSIKHPCLFHRCWIHWIECFCQWSSNRQSHSHNTQRPEDSWVKPYGMRHTCH